MFGSPHASPEFSDALLCNSCDRRNATVSCKIYLSLLLISHSLLGWSFQSYGVVIIIHTGLINLWNLQPMWGFHHLFQSLKFCRLVLPQRNLLELFHFLKKLLKNLVLKEERNLPMKQMTRETFFIKECLLSHLHDYLAE